MGTRTTFELTPTPQEQDGIVSATLEFADQMDSGDSIVLVAWRTGDMHAYNDHFASRFVRAKS